VSKLPFPGAVDHGEGRLTFALYAPGKRSVQLIGEFNGWHRGADRLHQDSSGLWWIEKRLTPGRYAYQFVVNDRLVIADPYARAVVRMDENPQRSVVHVGGAAYAWRHDVFDRPHYEDLILYEMHIGDFTPEGTFAAAVGKLDHLRDLGVNAVQVLPITASPPDDHWGYRPIFYFAVEPRYGSADDFRRFIDEAHARNIAVLMDLVLAHTDGTHPYAQLYSIRRSPWYGTQASAENEFGFPSFDFNRDPACCLAADVQRYWLEQFHVDGFRYDYLKLIVKHAHRRVDMLTESARACRADAYLIGEVLPEEPGLINDSDLNGCWTRNMGRALKALLYDQEIDGYKPQELDRALATLDAEKEGYDRPSRRVLYIESHDEGRVVLEAMEHGFSEEIARRKAGLAATVLLTAAGVPMLLQGQEFGECTPKNLNANEVRWHLLGTPGGSGMRDHFRMLIHLRRDHPALRGPNFKMLGMDPAQQLCAFHRWNEEGDELIIVANFSGEPRRWKVPFPRPGRWHDAVSGHELHVEDDDAEVEVDLYAAAVLVYSP
jgi:1,4-alpha-glucan branching enzyme